MSPFSLQDPVGPPGALAAAVIAFRKKDWRAYCAAAGEADIGLLSSVSYVPEKLLQGVASALRDACRLQRQLEEMRAFAGAAAAAAADEISVEEPAEAPMPVLDSPEFKALMEALHCIKGKGDAPWFLRRDRPQEILAATTEHLEVLAARDLKVGRQSVSVSFSLLPSLFLA